MTCFDCPDALNLLDNFGARHGSLDPDERLDVKAQRGRFYFDCPTLNYFVLLKTLQPVMDR
jgi:hypothetical protein